MEAKIFIVEIETASGKHAVSHYNNEKLDFVSDKDYIDKNGFYDLDYLETFTETEADEIIAGLGGKHGILKPTKTDFVKFLTEKFKTLKYC